MALEIEAHYRNRKLRSPIRRVGRSWIFIVGSVQYNLLFNGPKARTARENG